MTAGLAGAVAWAVVPFVPEAPFRLYAGTEHPPLDVAGPASLIAAAREGADSEFTFLVPAKARPVLVVSDRVDPRLREVLALRLLRLSALDPDERDIVRAHRDPGLFPLEPERFDLPEENAAMIAALVRIHETAVDPRPIGRLDESQLRSVHGHIARHYRLDLRHIVRAELERLAAVKRQGTSE